MVKIKTRKPVWSASNKKTKRIVGSKNVIKQSHLTGQTFFTKMKLYQLRNMDLDHDGVPNHKDCNPYDPKKQDYNPNVITPTPRERKTPVFRGYNVDDYYYDGSGYHLSPGAQRAEKKGLLSRLFK